jgi:hypothetical protein
VAGLGEPLDGVAGQGDGVEGLAGLHAFGGIDAADGFDLHRL